MGKVNHPKHYNRPGRKECIEEMLDIYGPEKVSAFCELNAYKYRYRAGLKGNKDEDLKKADWYLKKVEEIRSKKYVRKKILDVTCGSKTIWFNKNHPSTLYCDNRNEEYLGIWKSDNRNSERKCVINPDIQCDFTNLPFPDNSFYLVVFDPPHLQKVGETSWLAKKYGKLNINWQKMIHDGFKECMRVLKYNGVLIFKWSEYDISAKKVWEAIGQKPLFGHHSGKKSKTFWACYMKGQM